MTGKFLKDNEPGAENIKGFRVQLTMIQKQRFLHMHHIFLQFFRTMSSYQPEESFKIMQYTGTFGDLFLKRKRTNRSTDEAQNKVGMNFCFRNGNIFQHSSLSINRCM